MRFNGAVPADGAVTGSNLSGTNTGDQTLANSSDATSHTVTLSAVGGSVQLIEGTGITLTTAGTASNASVTIASTVTASPGGSDGQVQYNNGGAFGGSADIFYDDVLGRIGFGVAAGLLSKVTIKGTGLTSVTSSVNVTDSAGTSLFFVRDDGNRGMGTTTPLNSLHIKKDQVGATLVIVDNANSAGYAELLFSNDSGFAGEVGVGGSATGAPAYANRTFIEGDQNGVSYIAFGATADHRWFSGVGNTEIMRLTNPGNLLINSTTPPASMTAGLAMKTGTAPGGDVADQYSMYSADQAAGNACLHTRTELGDVVKLFKGAVLTVQDTTITHTAPGTPDFAIQNLVDVAPWGFVTQDEGNTVLRVIANLQTRVAELEARLNVATGHGLIA